MTDIRRFQQRRAFNIQKIAVALNQTAVEMRKEHIRSLAREIISKTPVDTGTAQASWNLSTGAPNFEINATGNQSRHRRSGIGITVPLRPGLSTNFLPDGFIGAGVSQKVEGLRITEENEIYLANGVPWIVPLEFGHSQQQPNGWVRAAVNDITHGLRAEAAAANKARKLGLRIRA